MPDISDENNQHSASSASSHHDICLDYASFASQVGSNATLETNMTKLRATMIIMMMSTMMMMMMMMMMLMMLMMMIMMDDNEDDDEHDVAPSLVMIHHHRQGRRRPCVPLDPEMEGGHHPHCASPVLPVVLRIIMTTQPQQSYGQDQPS